MGGIFGVVSNTDCVMDIFFGTDYHSHLGTKRGGMCILEKDGFNREIHNIENIPEGITLHISQSIQHFRIFYDLQR